MSTNNLHVAGSLDLTGAAKAVALVGARAASRAGMDRARGLAHDLARAGWVILSGGAVGIDAAAHRGALEAGGKTVAVVAGGVARPYPARNADLFAEIRAAGGAVVSPFGDDEPIRRWHFVRRNEVLAELARAVVVVEAGPRSGSRHTAQAARELGRTLGACPGSAGADALIEDGAALIETASDVLAAIAGQPRRPAPRPLPDMASDGGRVLAALDGRAARDVVELAERAGLPLRKVTAELMTLELDGLARPAPGGTFLRAGGHGSL